MENKNLRIENQRLRKGSTPPPPPPPPSPAYLLGGQGGKLKIQKRADLKARAKASGKGKPQMEVSRAQIEDARAKLKKTVRGAHRASSHV